MVSSGISTNINPVRPVETGMSANNGKSASIEFGELMAQTMSAGVDPGAELATALQANGQTVVNSTSTDVAQRIPKKEEATVSAKAEAKEQAGVETKVDEAEDAIRKEIKEKFDVTDEDIDKALETLGLTMADLLDKGNLMDFVVELTGMESSVDLLVMGDMSAKVDELFGFVQETFTQLADEYGVSVEEMADIFNELTGVAVDVPEDVEVLTDNQAEVKQQVALDNETAETLNRQSAIETEAENLVETSKEVKTKVNDANQVTGDTTNGDMAPEVVDTKTGAETKQQSFDGSQNAQTMQQGIINNLTEAITEAFNINNMNQAIDPVQLINQIVENAKLTLTQEVTSMEMMLNPESLGKINLNISVREGVVTATIVAQNEAVKEAIESQIVMLKDNLNNQGLKVEAVEVTVESHAFEANAQQGENNTFNSQQEEAKKKTNRQLRVDSLEDLQIEDLSDEEKIVLDMMAQDGNQINFTA